MRATCCRALWVAFLWILLLPWLSYAELRTLAFPPFPIQLFWDEKDGVIQNAFIRSPAGVYELPLLKSHLFISSQSSQTRVDDDPYEDHVVQVTFQESANPSSGLHLWIGLLSERSTAWVATTPIARTKWDKVPTTLIKPKGSLLYISPQTPTYDGLESFDGEDTLSFIYLVYLSKEGFSFLRDSKFYELLIPTLQIAVNSEYEPMKRLAYTRMLTEVSNLSKGLPPSSPLIRNFNWKKILTLRW